MIEELIEKTDTKSLVWSKVYTRVFTLRMVYNECVYILFSTNGEAHLKVYNLNDRLLGDMIGVRVRNLYTSAKKQYFGKLHDQTHKRK